MAGKRTQAKTKGRKKRMGTMDFILLIVFLCLTVFTIAMIALFTVYGSVPDADHLRVRHAGRRVRHPRLDKDHQGEEAGQAVAACGHETGKGGGGTDCTADRGAVRRDRSCWQGKTTRRKSGII